jgi:hypothetical protein
MTPHGTVKDGLWKNVKRTQYGWKSIVPWPVKLAVSKTDMTRIMVCQNKFVWKPGKLQSHKIVDVFWCSTVPHRAQNLCLNFIKLNIIHRGCTFIVVGRLRRKPNTMTSVQFPDHHILINYACMKWAVVQCACRYTISYKSSWGISQYITRCT